MVKAILDRVFIKLEEPKHNGIIVELDNERNIGVVLSKGEEVTDSVKVGDKVLFHKWDDLPSPEKDVVVVRESSLLGVFDE